MNNIEKEVEGVIKFQLDFEETNLIRPDQVETLNIWREKLFELKLIGQEPARYDGLGYGNISHRIRPENPEFIITGSQTSHLPRLTIEHYSLVVESDIHHNRLVARGLTKPSSEALSHSAFYAARKSINYVFHVHSPEIWANVDALKIPITSSSIPYGTPEMAGEIEKLFDSGKIDSKNIVAMGGHRDGVIAFGSTADEAGNRIIQALKDSI